MLFNTPTYAGFFAIIFVLSWALSTAPKLRLLLLLGASYYFYAAWNVRFLPLIFASSSIDYLLARRIHAASDDLARKRWLWLTVLVNLGALAYFKYTNFVWQEVTNLVSVFGATLPPITWEIALPVGVSFFTFESMSYVIDVYRRELEPHDSYVEYLTFVAFFPHLVAGPIVRPKDLLPQLSRRPRWDATLLSEGLFWIAIGLLKKVALGDYLALNLVDRVFGSPLQYSALEVYTGVVGYALQIYCDFSGYTDIATGSALLLGVRFPPNFDSPYQSRSITEFWRRWHISLSSWLRDYLYIPLGGSRQGRLLTYRNLFLTMLLGGLWHGASWNFVVWGAFHGALLALERWRNELREARQPEPARPTSPWRALGSTLLTFHLVLVGWIFFRAPTFAHAKLIFARLSSLTSYHPNLAPSILVVLALALFTHFLPTSVFSRIKRTFCALPFPAQGGVLFVTMVIVKQLSQAELVPFVYFQF